MGNPGDRSSRSPADLPGQRHWQSPSATEQDGWYDDAQYGRVEYGPGDYDSPGYEVQGYQPEGYDTGERGPVRGYPPGPDHVDPVYPSGKFTSWEEPPDRSETGYQDAYPGGYQQVQDYGFRQEQDYGDYPQQQSYGLTGDPSYRDQQSYDDQLDYEEQDYSAFGDDRDAPRFAKPGRGATRRGLMPRLALSRSTLLSIATGVLVIAVGVAAYVYASGPRAGASAATPAARQTNAQPTASAASPAAALGKWGHLQSRTSDRVPLTLAELYPAQFLINGVSFARATVRSDTDCTRGVFGTQLQADVKKGHCTQVMRASYVTGDGRVMGTIGVINLSTAAAAAAVGKVSGADEFIGPLSSAHGPTRKMAQGTGVVQAAVKGHYLILTFAEFTNLKSPSTSADRQQLLEFSNDLVTGSANISLSTRMVKGTPGGTAP